MDVVRPASTVVLVKKLTNESFQIYMTQRPVHFKFLGGYHVFPGGSVAPEDERIVQEIPCRLPLLQNDFPSYNYWVAAVREVFEETGLLLARDRSGNGTWDIKYQEDRFALLREDISFGEFLAKNQLTLDLHSLHYLGRRITPKGKPARFDTRFFLVPVPASVTCEPYEGEVISEEWISPEDALRKWQKGSMLLANPTIQTLQTLSQNQQLEHLSQLSIGESR